MRLATTTSTSSPFGTVPQPKADWDAGYVRPYGPGVSQADVASHASGMGVQMQPTPFPGSHLFLPASPANGRALLFLHGSEGGAAGYSDDDAAFWASRGYTTMSYAYFGVPGQPKQLGNVSVDDVLSGAEWLRSQTGGRPIGLVGVSRGAELALIAASHAPSDLVGAVAVHSPQDKAVGSFAVKQNGDMDYARDAHGAPEAAWTYHGTPITPGTPTDVEHIAAPVFLSVGTKDDVWGPEGTYRTEARLTAAGKHPTTKYVPDAGHVIFGAPYEWLQDQRDAFFRAHLG